MKDLVRVEGRIKGVKVFLVDTGEEGIWDLNMVHHFPHRDGNTLLSVSLT